MPRSLTHALVCAAVLLLAGPLRATAPPLIAPPPDAESRVKTLIEGPNLPREIEAPAAPLPPPRLVPDSGSLPVVVPGDDSPPPPPPHPLTDFRLSQTYLPKFGANGFGNLDTDLWAQFALPGWKPLGKPFLLKAGFGVHLWDGPVTNQNGRDPQMPGTVYDLYLDFGWKPRPAEWLFLDLGITPGLYTDFRAIPDQAFRLRGRALAIIATSERFQFVAGLLYVNRDDLKLIPAGGFIWSPDDNTRLQVTFPQPKLARRVGTMHDAGWWIYAAGEFGGGTWAYQRPNGSANTVDYNDYRVIVGTELKRADGWLARIEAGYVFGRELIPLNEPRVTPNDTVMVRVALIF